MTQYYSEIDGFASIYPNRYFTAEYGNVDRDSLDKLREQHDCGDVSNVDADVVAYFNSFWTYETLQDRRIELPWIFCRRLGSIRLRTSSGLNLIKKRYVMKFERRRIKSSRNACPSGLFDLFGKAGFVSPIPTPS